MLAVVLPRWECWAGGAFKGSFQLLLLQFYQLLFLRSEGSCPFPSSTWIRWFLSFPILHVVTLERDGSCS